MAAAFDVASRLAEGRPAVDDMQTYVWASRLRGYQDCDLTSHAAQLHDWYGGDDGLDLQALDADCAALGSAADAADEAVQSARQQLGALAAAWSGAGGDAAADFLRRHCDSAAALAQAVRTAAEACAVLRDELWRIVDRKVQATASVARGADAHRATWLAACGSILGGDVTGKDAADVVENQVKPFVHKVIRGEWVPAMHSAADAADVAFRTALDAVRPGHLRFDVPGELVPSPAAPSRVPPSPVESSAVLSPVSAPGVLSAAEPPRLSAPAAQPWTSGEYPPDPVPWPPPDGWASAQPMASNPWTAPVAPQTTSSPLDALVSPASWPTAGSVPGLTGAGWPDTGIGSSMPSTLGRALDGLLDGTPWPEVADPLASNAEADPFGVPELDELMLEGEDDRGSHEDVEEGGDADDADGSSMPEGPDGQSAAESQAAEPHGAAGGATATADEAGAAAPADRAPGPVGDPTSGPPPGPDVAAPPAHPAVWPASPGGETPCEIAAGELPQAGG